MELEAEQRPLVDHEKLYVPIRFQIFLIILSIIFAGFALYRPLHLFTTTDPRAELLSITPQLIQEFGSEPATVKVGFFIRDFPVFNMVKGDFTIVGIVWFEFDPSIISLETLNKFVFDKAEFLQRSATYSRIVGDKLFVRYDVKLKFNLPLQYKYFPLDDHRLSIMLTHELITPGEIKFSSGINEFIVGPNMESAGWGEVGRQVKLGYTEAVLDTTDATKKVYHPAALFSIDYRRIGIRYSLTIFLPLLLIFYLSLFSFSLDPINYRGSIVSLATGGITALLAYRFVIESLSPSVGYFMLSDYIFFLFLFALCIVFFLVMIGALVPVWIKKMMVICLHLYVDICIGYFFLFWIK